MIRRLPLSSLTCLMSSSSTTQQLPFSKIPLITTAASFREWRKKAFQDGQSVGYVPTMGALHHGHLSLVRRSLADNDLTVVSIFVNPAQFAPREDLGTYPRTLSKDIELLAAESLAVPGQSQPRAASAIFLPSVQEMYPSGISQDIKSQKGTFVQVKGYDHQMEGKSRPTFFRGVATVVTKLFNVVQPTNAYFGQKDIQQALLLRRLCRDLLLGHPDASHLHIVPTARDPNDGLALSSRNAYLSPAERRYASTLYDALRAMERTWKGGRTKRECLSQALRLVVSRIVEASDIEGQPVKMRLDYVEMNDMESFEELDDRSTWTPESQVIISGALWVGKTRLIDNILVGGDLTR
ncbi:hypothetical protein AX17_004138 [Amanita inopinata Kibby_2008]|nr:hypothetical protein AX17_004138 [Amanita inopinata Kibby_2008]